MTPSGSGTVHNARVLYCRKIQNEYIHESKTKFSPLIPRSSFEGLKKGFYKQNVNRHNFQNE
jgi:hypothetical protein